MYPQDRRIPFPAFVLLMGLMGLSFGSPGALCTEKSGPGRAWDRDLPEETLLYAELDLSAFRRCWKGLALSGFWNDPDIRLLREGVREAVDRAAGGRAGDRAGTLREGEALFRSCRRITLAVFPRSSSAGIEDPPPLLLMLEFGEGESAPTDRLSRLCAGLGAAVETLEGAPLRAIRLGRGRPDRPATRLFFAGTGSDLIIGTDAGRLEAIARARARGPAAGRMLREVRAFRNLRRRMEEKGHPLFFLALNVRAASKEAGAEEGAPLFSWVGAATHARDRLLVDTLEMDYAERTGPLRLLDAFPGVLEPAGPIPTDAVSFTSLRVDPGLFLDRVRSVLGAHDPSSAERFTGAVEGFFQGLGLRPGEVFQAFDGRITLFMTLPPMSFIPHLSAYVPLREEANLAPDPARAKAYFERQGCRLRRAPMPSGREMYYLQLPSVEAGFFTPAAGRRGDRLVLASSPLALKRVFRRLDEGDARGTPDLRRQPAFQELLEAVSGEQEEAPLALLYLDLGRLAKLVYGTLKPWTGLFIAEGNIPFDISRLPPEEVFRKYFQGLMLTVYDREAPGGAGGRILSLRVASPFGSLPLLTTTGLPFLFLASRMPAVRAGPSVAKEPREAPPRKETPAATGADRPFLGIYLDPEDSPEAGIYIQGVVPASPAEEAGLLTGDVLLSVGGKAIATSRDLMEVLAGRKPGDLVEVGFRRGGRALTAPLVLGKASEFTKR